MPVTPTHFAYLQSLQSHDEQLVRLGMLAERYFCDDPNTTSSPPREPQYDLIRRLLDQGILPREVAQLLDQVRRDLHGPRRNSIRQ